MSKPKHPRMLADTEAEAILRNVHVSPRKLNLVAGLIRNRSAADAVATLTFSKRRIAQTVKKLLQSAIANAASKSSGILASIIGAVTLAATASGVFGEMQSALNTVWKAKPLGTTVSRLIRARGASIGLVAALGFLLLTWCTL